MTVQYRRATEIERRRYGVEWRAVGSEWRTQRVAWSHTIIQDWNGRPISRSEQTALKACRHEGNYNANAALSRYARTLGITEGEAAARVARQMASLDA